MSTPQTTIYICSGVRLDPRYEHSVHFSTPEAQREYFAGKVVKTFPAYSYLRKSWPLQVEATMEQAKTWTYLFFQNVSTWKTYYYFITRIEYKNDNMVELTLELDVLQTYLFDFTMLPSFVERQHTETDEPGEHTLDEGLELGELVDNSVTLWEDLSELCILVLCTFNPNYTDTISPVIALAGIYNGVFSGLTCFAVSMDQWTQWAQKLDDLSEAGFLDGIVAMWMYPKNLVKLAGEQTWGDTSVAKIVDGAKTALFQLATPPRAVDGYTPKNRKVLCYPFSMLYVSNNSGSSAVYRWERFELDQAVFEATGALSPEGAVKMYPTSYNGLQYTGTNGLPAYRDNYEQGLTLGSFPTCAWDADIYKLWLAQNQNQHALTTVTGGVKIFAGAAAGVAGAFTSNLGLLAGGATAAIGGGMQVAEHMAQKRDMEIQPPQSRGNYSANVNIAAGQQTFAFYHKSISAENAKIIDDYFSMYGYKLNKVRTPNLRARKAWTYVKTVGCNINGNMCTEDRVKITSIFDHGITWWTNGDRIADYSQDNTI